VSEDETELSDPRAPRTVPPTPQRGFADDGHRQPWPPQDRTGRRWAGFSRIKDRPARRKANARRLRKHATQIRKRGMEMARTRTRRPSLIELQSEKRTLTAIEEAVRKATKKD
jgi:hypothetical protein